MIVEFVVDPQALSMPSVDAPVRRATHDAFLRLWAHVGVLVYSGTRLENSDLATALAKLPQDVRKRWEIALKQNRHMPGPSGWAGLECMECVRDLAPLEDAVDVACVNEVRAVFLGVLENEASRVFASPRIEIVRFDCANQSESRLPRKWLQSPSKRVPKSSTSGDHGLRDWPLSAGPSSSLIGSLLKWSLIAVIGTAGCANSWLS